MKKKKAPQVIEFTSEELKQLIQRVKKGLSEEDAKIIINIIETHEFICGQLEIKNVQLKRLLKQIFGIKSEKTKNIINDSDSNSDSDSDSDNNESNSQNNNNSENTSKPDTPNIDDEDKEEVKKESNPSSEDNDEKKDMEKMVSINSLVPISSKYRIQF